MNVERIEAALLERQTERMKPTAAITDPRVVKALAHPLRVRILTLLDKRTASPTELAEELGAPLGNVSYHVRQLASFGLIKLVKRTPRRGAIEHHYKAQPRRQVSDAAWAKVPDIVKEAAVNAALADVAHRVAAAAGAGGFSRCDANLANVQLRLDEEGWQAVARELAALLERVDEIHAQSRRRASEDGHGQERDASLVTMLFEPAEVDAEEGATKRAQRAGPQTEARRRGRRAPEPSSG
jgi:DNA-binding transcriptional ArsR family regulator